MTIVLPGCMQLLSCPSHVLLLLLLLTLLPLYLGQCRVAEDQGGAEYTLVQQSSSSSQQKQFCLTESQVFRREGVDYCFTEQQHYGAVYTRTGLKS